MENKVCVTIFKDLIEKHKKNFNSAMILIMIHVRDLLRVLKVALSGKYRVYVVQNYLVLKLY